MFSFEGETVLDPFLGSGTTSLAAKNLNRNSIGYEINTEFASIIKEKLENNKMKIYDQDEIIFFEDEINNDVSFKELPYLFFDPHNLDKKIDIKKIQFGSKIDNQLKIKKQYFNVKKIISPEKLMLNNGQIIKLIGIKENKAFIEDAVNFLKNKFNKRKIYLQYDEIKYDTKNNLLCYVYLDNKTFINNHLIRSGFVNIDLSYDYIHKTKFLKSLKV